jgi:hypothetical protein
MLSAAPGEAQRWETCTSRSLTPPSPNRRNTGPHQGRSLDIPASNTQPVTQSLTQSLTQPLYSVHKMHAASRIEVEINVSRQKRQTRGYSIKRRASRENITDETSWHPISNRSTGPPGDGSLRNAGCRAAGGAMVCRCSVTCPAADWRYLGTIIHAPGSLRQVI